MSEHVVTIVAVYVDIADPAPGHPDVVFSHWLCRCTCGTEHHTARLRDAETWATRIHAEPPIVPAGTDTHQDAP